MFEKKLNNLLELSGYRKFLNLNFFKRYQFKEILRKNFANASLIGFLGPAPLLFLLLFIANLINYNIRPADVKYLFYPTITFGLYALLFAIINTAYLIEKKYYRHKLLSFFNEEKNLKELYDTICLQPYDSLQTVDGDFKKIVSEQLDGRDSNTLWDMLEKADTTGVWMMNDFRKNHHDDMIRKKALQENKSRMLAEKKDKLLTQKLKKLSPHYLKSLENTDDTVEKYTALNRVNHSTDTIPRHDYQKYL